MPARRPGFTHNYLEPLEALADRRRVIFYDQLGCGQSDRPDDPSLWTVERFVEEVAQVRAAFGLERLTCSAAPGAACWPCSTCSTVRRTWRA